MWRMAGIMQPRAGSIVVGVIFGNTGEHERFLELLGEMVDRFRVVLHAHVELDNHYHLIVQTPDANLSKAIQWLNVSHSHVVAWGLGKTAASLGAASLQRFVAARDWRGGRRDGLYGGVYGNQAFRAEIQ
jgi:hypothetical protein